MTILWCSPQIGRPRVGRSFGTKLGKDSVKIGGMSPEDMIGYALNGCGQLWQMLVDCISIFNDIHHVPVPACLSIYSRVCAFSWGWVWRNISQLHEHIMEDDDDDSEAEV